MYTSLLTEKDANGYRTTLCQRQLQDLPQGDVTVAIDYSSLNYKDALAITGKGPIVRSFPMVPGIDFSGTVTESTHPVWKAGDRVILTGWGVGEKHPGGLAQMARVNGNWLVALPENATTWQAMAIGTAGLTAMLCVAALERNGITPQAGTVLVTGASGGVGSFAVALLSRLGYNVTASTGRTTESEWLTTLGASAVISRDELSNPGKPLQKERWAAVIDTVGSHTLANACASVQYGGVVAACGMAQGMDFPATVAPFILRGVTLAGVDSVMIPLAQRQDAWQRLTRLLDNALLESLATTYPLAETISLADKLFAGEIRGRAVISCR
ncbi:MDR family oxidoreductase [Shimwellia blattae]|uniref:Zinc-binding alcohol dehydrogenase n=1 Tax=Shimwellia blattae (strain ATCC 29907 / DSM 4481 / JCM 1650 / NBRC 105725 / CDC 9005-74) TaxID=630626 RepID=I2B8U5_SHIBC|nr:MDR family oxidoreductase [Shimwellia blattae]AFJ46949.1 zinc-binding alcohol dehydrogenase [Shimwellia blattae DSM 4481 = NBRC 105725]GAB82390.1 putative quinone oxidoreductase YhdH [Shimwellia blattae DSM 4481 = NBRC 105725]VDY64443.1 Putative quinone oxidoreductase YhdH [Shimwellia blattae]VEC22551.1 Putative quinone oxidoreductase YhdH [Shimwellia blattae]